ncbi:isomerase [Pokkaliibacter plantistimulans]|uniref:Isomerase n=1 Tax=Proteobacteria bacterium 228 TaxID=2083153 RepID=A0A2S5KGX3_9PROT|nr:fumarylacetoacetate hydrolase family protein [Pokkaliibacter plantistimulans]PPC74010.1 isomerase [Pokkaliibacter plantistimulans]
MKLGTVNLSDGSKAVVLVLEEGQLLFNVSGAERSLNSSLQLCQSMLDVIDASPASLERIRGLFLALSEDERFLLSPDGFSWCAPLPEPRQMRDFSVFPTHIRQAPAGMVGVAAFLKGEPMPPIKPFDIPEVYRSQPIYYKCNRFSVIGHEATVRWPRYSQLMDFELELGVIIGKTGVNIPLEKARQHVFGYTIYNDFSARDTQFIEMQGKLGPAKGKDFDTGNAIGPWIVTADEIEEPQELTMSVRVNGECWATGSTAEMLHSIDAMISYLSRDETLYAGEFIGSGTMGNGCGLEQNRYLHDGDVIELEIERIGILRNSVRRQE